MCSHSEKCLEMSSVPSALVAQSCCCQRGIQPVWGTPGTAQQEEHLPVPEVVGLKNEMLIICDGMDGQRELQEMLVMGRAPEAKDCWTDVMHLRGEWLRRCSPQRAAATTSSIFVLHVT